MNKEDTAGFENIPAFISHLPFRRIILLATVVAGKKWKRRILKLEDFNDSRREGKSKNNARKIDTTYVYPFFKFRPPFLRDT